MSDPQPSSTTKKRKPSAIHVMLNPRTHRTTVEMDVAEGVSLPLEEE